MYEEYDPRYLISVVKRKGRFSDPSPTSGNDGSEEWTKQEYLQREGVAIEDVLYEIHAICDLLELHKERVERFFLNSEGPGAEKPSIHDGYGYAQNDRASRAYLGACRLRGESITGEGLMIPENRMDQAQIDELLLHCLRTSPDKTGDGRVAPLSESDWAELLQQSARHRITPLFYHRLRTFHPDIPIPPT